MENIISKYMLKENNFEKIISRVIKLKPREKPEKTKKTEKPVLERNSRFLRHPYRFHPLDFIGLHKTQP